MRSFGNETSAALAAYLKGVETKYAHSKVTLITFDNQIEVVAKNVAPSVTIHPAWIEPRSTTALRDAVVNGISVADAEEEEAKAAGKTVELFIAIFTDGSDNASSTSAQTLSSMIAQRESKENWDFTFLAANQNAISSASAIGISSKNAMSVGGGKGRLQSAMCSAARKSKKSGFSAAMRSGAKQGC